MPRLHAIVVVCGVWLGAASTHAQDALSGSDEVIDDPELGAVSNEPAAGGSEEIIADPELAGATSKPQPSAANSGSSPAAAPLSEVHLVLHSRGNRDISENDRREEIWESTTVLLLDATLRRSDSLRFGLGVMARYHFASLAHTLRDVEPRRYELGVLPTAAYIDGSVSSVGLHIRAGYQPVPLGRFDLFSAINVLSVADLRDGVAAIPGLPEVGQLAFKVDYSPGGWFSLSAVYVPFFMPHLVSVLDSDYALFPGKQKLTESGFRALRELISPEELQAALRTRFTPSGRETLAQGMLSAFTPAANLLNPQGALRATGRGGWGELSLTLATALEHLPTFRLSEAMLAALSSDQLNNSFDPDAIRVEYKRFAVFSADAAIDLAPFSLGFELAYQMHRALYAVGTAYEGDPRSVPVPGYSDMLQAGARIEYIEDQDFIFAVEAFASYALSLPSDPERGWMYLESGRFFRGAGGLVGYATEFGLRLQLAAAWLSGPTVALAPQISFEIIDELQIEVGAFILEGQAPPLYATPISSLGGTFTNVDHVFVGTRLAL